MRKLAIWLGVALWFMAAPVPAVEVAGVTVPDSAALADGETLVLNGAGVRTKFFFKIYVGALYLGAKVTTPEAAYGAPGGRRVLMHFLYDEVEAAKLVEAWNEGFEGNLDKAELAHLRPRIDAFNALFTDVRRGDEVRLDYLPGKGTEVWYGDTRRGVVEGADFQAALLRIWLGGKPADKSLKAALLGE